MLFTSVVLTGLLIPVLGPETALPSAADLASADLAGAGPDAPDAASVDLAGLPAEPPVQPARPAADELFGADCDTRIQGSTVMAVCRNPFPETDLVRLHVECDRWWDLDGDSAPVAVHPAGRVELTGRCWKEVRAVWVSHERG
ncbi:hypothetical protein DEJ50_26060 [Streptomyces venezuelae]|uniref:Uncharacterized protein n=1 Tax=Streptomyces venezuelae TaxID=54571 RepID=A0A5P2DD29_STRVZ|nr:hypothetical protein DEJ50_26060 [Streptomyces venezuelae]